MQPHSQDFASVSHFIVTAKRKKKVLNSEEIIWLPVEKLSERISYPERNWLIEKKTEFPFLCITILSENSWFFFLILFNSPKANYIRSNSFYICTFTLIPFKSSSFWSNVKKPNSALKLVNKQSKCSQFQRIRVYYSMLTIFYVCAQEELN